MSIRRIGLGVAVVLAAGLVIARQVQDHGKTRSDFCDPPELIQEPQDVEQDADPVAVSFEPLAPLEGTIGLADVGNGRLLVATKEGVLWSVPHAGGDPTKELDLSAEVANGVEQGLLGVAVDPQSTHVYLYATLLDGTARILEYALDQEHVIPVTRRDILVLQDPDPTHNGGRLAFDEAGNLLLGIGDGGNGDSTGAAQDIGSPFGKLLRITPTPDGEEPYLIPTDNPFVGEEGARGEVWALGFRNPWGWSLDPETGDLWVGDVGQLCFEEISMAPDAGRAANFGWSHLEGGHEFSGPVLLPGGEPSHDAPIADLGERPRDLVPPLLEYDHAPEACGAIGGYVYRGAALPALDGTYIWTDLCNRVIYTLRKVGGGWVRGQLSGDVPAGTASFGQDRDGELYLLSLSDGPIRISPP